MSSNDRLRVEIAFDGNQVLSVYVPAATADDLEGALAGKEESLSFEAEDGHYTVLMRKIVYVKRLARESRVGFGSTG
jgi:hypothetical protein